MGEGGGRRCPLLFAPLVSFSRRGPSNARGANVYISSSASRARQYKDAEAALGKLITSGFASDARVSAVPLSEAWRLTKTPSSEVESSVSYVVLCYDIYLYEYI